MNKNYQNQVIFLSGTVATAIAAASSHEYVHTICTYVRTRRQYHTENTMKIWLKGVFVHRFFFIFSFSLYYFFRYRLCRLLMLLNVWVIRVYVALFVSCLKNIYGNVERNENILLPVCFSSAENNKRTSRRKKKSSVSQEGI